jgi:hypothetical protein
VIVTQLDLLTQGTEQALKRREDGMALTLGNDLNAQYRELLLCAIEVLAAKGDPFSADDARAIAGDPPRFTHPNVAGAVFNAAARAGIIRMVGVGISRRAVGHGNLTRLWTGTK